jgi:hypothetical protein
MIKEQTTVVKIRICRMDGNFTPLTLTKYAVKL